MADMLAGRVAVVTGAGRGIGRGVALGLAAEGAKVVVNDYGVALDGSAPSSGPAFDVVEEIRRAGGEAVPNTDSVATWDGAAKIIGAAVEKWGRLDALVTCAGILRDRMVFNMSEEEWDAVLAVHLKGTFNCIRHACTHMRERRYGRIVTFSSGSGLFGNPGQANYGAAESAIGGLTKVAARDLGKYGITVNAICPVAGTRMTVNEEVRRARELRRQPSIQREDRGVAQIEELDPDEVVDAIRARGGRAFANADSVADFAAAERIVETAVREFGAIDILVNNAGILRDRMIFNMSVEEWDAVIAVHLKGTFNCTRHATRRMREQRRGRIISISSTSGVYGNSGQANYGAAKDGIAGLTRVAARDVGRYGITVNAVCPGALTRMTATVPQTARAVRAERGLSAGAGERRFPLRNFGPENVAPWVVYLATDAAKNVNGQLFLVMAGMVALLNYPAPVRTIAKAGRWTPEEIATIFPHTLGQDLANPAPPQGS